MTRWQVLLWLDRYAKRLAYENGQGDEGGGEAQAVTLDKEATLEQWHNFFQPAKKYPADNSE